MQSTLFETGLERYREDYNWNNTANIRIGMIQGRLELERYRED